MLLCHETSPFAVTKVTTFARACSPPAHPGQSFVRLIPGCQPAPIRAIYYVVRRRYESNAARSNHISALLLLLLLLTSPTFTSTSGL